MDKSVFVFSLLLLLYLKVIAGDDASVVDRIPKPVPYDVNVQRLPSPKIVNGVEADLSEYPWQVSIQLDYGGTWFHICGGSLIKFNWVLTAAHCTDGWSTANLRIDAGTNTLYAGTSRSIARIIQHPQYDSTADGLPNDVALIELSSPYQRSNSIDIVNLPTDRFQDFTHLPNCWISGWGKLPSETTYNTTMREANIMAISYNECVTRYSGYNNADIFDHHLCIFDEVISSCQGDWGSPFVCDMDGTMVQAGVISWSYERCSGKYPTVCARVASFIEWINHYI